MITPSEANLVYRVLDANYNRAVEGLRVVEEFARFVISDPRITSELKQLRHQLGVVCHPCIDQWASQRESIFHGGSNTRWFPLRFVGGTLTSSSQSSVAGAASL